MREALTQDRLEATWQRVADVVARHPNGVTAADVAAETGMPLGTLRNYLTGTVNRGQVRRVRRRATYVYYPPTDDDA